MKQSEFSLTAISPIDGRYRNQVEELAGYSSEFGIIKYRLSIEIRYLIALSNAGVVRKINGSEQKILNKIIDDFDLSEAEKVKEIENTTRHDVKAIEYYLKQKLSRTSLADTLEFVHFGLTSEDIDNLANRLMLRDGLEKIVIPNLEKLNAKILNKSKTYKRLPMIARTHGQPAVPTVLGKELLVFYERIQKEIILLKKTKLNGKINGAVGNYNALYFVFPKIDWKKFSKQFIESFGLNPIFTTTQINPYDDTILVFQALERINGVLIGFDQDIWRYISDHWFVQENRKGEVGSSTMPQKINPILFENSEGNLIVANSLIHGFTSKLLISRLQRDLSSSTIMRNFGVALAHCLLAYKSCLEGLLRIKANEQKITKDLNSDWSILSEAVQIYLKKEGVKNGYEILKELTRGEKMTKEDFLNMVDKLPLNENQKSELRKLSPSTYIGIVN
ncbi:MAG: hypothetical protein ACD_37C00169G0002 [uncultured bacterium]|nr:MAG: hypothetical protein ACD_37C00169G0002 [uncultured bacterium]